MENPTETKKTLFKTYQVLWYVVYLIEVLVGLRVLFRLLGANPASAFVNLIYSLSSIFVLPFSAIFPSPAGGGFVLDTPALIALIIYPLGCMLLVKLLQLGKPTSEQEAQSLDDENLPK